ncbi:hypothetical protein [Vibrio algivorus]|uniref:Type 4 fimbrial biogenesis protein PilX N-terminal domain-containing protein n=1 Tax=Vibrio algivorus TaxID=1667024 RepID=A0ABQ6EQT0_9VIBR|nr:hypothetical protein [Vibrio algivorus]GLT15532.1 hypothetical protein GCM10007931_25070 [Vibrio algivorus]
MLNHSSLALLLSKQRGAATLLVAVLLLASVLVLSLASYKGVFFQAKRAQNEIEARIAHWIGEGGLECAYTKMYQDRDQSVLVSGTIYFDSDCVVPMNLSSMNIDSLGGQKYRIEPEFEQSGILISPVSKVVDFSRNRSTGAIKATADLYIRGTGTFNPPDPGNELASGWECVGLRYKNNFEMIGAIDNKQFYAATNYPSASFNPNGKQCLSSHVTTSSANLKRDFQYDDKLDPFQEAFDLSSSLWTEVRDNPIYDFDIIQTSSLIVGNASVNPASKCGEAVKNKIESGSTRIWVEGSCELYNDPVVTQPQWLSEIAAATQDTDGVLLLVHNGIFSIHGSGEFKGSLFHINNSFSPTASDWNGLYGESVKNQLSSYFPSVPTSADVAYVQNGSFVFTGGQSLDLDGQIAYFNNGLDFKYNSDVLDSIFGVLPPRWLKGSWNDF